MSKEVTKGHANNVLPDTVTWSPTKGQQVAKARFWQRMSTHWRDPASMTLDEIATIAKTSSLNKWMRMPQFQSWFFDTNTAQIKIQAAAETAVDSLVQILHAPLDPKEGVTAPSKVRAAEIIMQYAGMTPPTRVETKTTHDVVSDMDPAELKTFLKGHMHKLLLSMDPDERAEVLNSVTVKAED